jgi:spore coat protein U-like protein
MKKLAILLIGLMLSNFSAFAQTSGSVTANTKASATLAAMCTISSQNVSFGQIALPVSNQSATSSIAVQCTKGSSYTIGLAYGGVYGQGTSEYETCGPDGCEWHLGNTAYGYGMMNGTSQGDKIAYSIQVPNNASEVWNAGEYNYTSTGTGLSQSIPVVATLQPSQTTDKYPAADTYLDTVTATLTY